MIIDPLDKFGVKEWEDAGKPKEIATPSTGTNHIDVAALRERGVTVHCLLDDREALEEIRASSEFTFFLLLAALRRQKRLLQLRERGPAGSELYGKLIGLVGFGRIGKNMRRYLWAFGAANIFYDPYEEGSVDELEELFYACDGVVVSCTLTDETEGMIGGSLLSCLKKDAILVNTSRGRVMNEPELVEFLKERPDVFYATDVLSGETTGESADSPLWDLENVIITPHIAGHTVESEAKAHNIASGLLSRSL